MATYTCQRCGQESRCGHNRWADRHPVTTVAGATITAIFTLVVVVGYPWLLIVGAVGYGVYILDREYRRRRALAARADWEYRRLIERSVKPVPSRGADHWARTEPMRRAS